MEHPDDTEVPRARSRLRAAAPALGLVCLVFAALQLVRPQLRNPPVAADLQAPEAVKRVLTASCYNCHSNQTQLLWFDKVVPGYWIVAKDVTEARRHMDFSDFGTMPAARQKAFLYEAVNQVRLGAMPLGSYRAFHPGSAVSAAGLAVLEDYLHATEDHRPATPAQRAAADAQYEKWIAAPGRPDGVSPAPNGLAFPADYRAWRPISTTERCDNHTLRVILGNDVAIRAVAEHTVQPWPDGAAFAKLAWDQQADGAGTVRAGEFRQVEFMVKDARKYASTEGWGFGRWLGTALVPYGKDRSFAGECTGCHAPMKGNDFVYTLPIREQAQPSDAFNADAALPASLPYPPLGWTVIASTADTSHLTMATLYGNDLAAGHARTDPNGPYPAGAVLSLVTWRSREDPHWYGARIPGKPQSIEFVNVETPASGKPGQAYQAFAGDPLAPESAEGAAATQPRVALILALRASVMP